jgi:hypothetical protein
VHRRPGQSNKAGQHFFARITTNRDRGCGFDNSWCFEFDLFKTGLKVGVKSSCCSCVFISAIFRFPPGYYCFAESPMMSDHRRSEAGPMQTDPPAVSQFGLDLLLFVFHVGLCCFSWLFL